MKIIAHKNILKYPFYDKNLHFKFLDAKILAPFISMCSMLTFKLLGIKIPLNGQSLLLIIEKNQGQQNVRIGLVDNSL